jgi:hypothetical protein
MKDYEEQRSVYVQIALDTNCINARQADPDLNQLERWLDNGVITTIRG